MKYDKPRLIISVSDQVTSHGEKILSIADQHASSFDLLAVGASMTVYVSPADFAILETNESRLTARAYLLKLLAKNRTPDASLVLEHGTAKLPGATEMPTPPSPDVIEYVLKLIDQNDAPDPPSAGTYEEGIRLGIMWATGQFQGHPLS